VRHYYIKKQHNSTKSNNFNRGMTNSQILRQLREQFALAMTEFFQFQICAIQKETE